MCLWYFNCVSDFQCPHVIGFSVSALLVSYESLKQLLHFVLHNVYLLLTLSVSLSTCAYYCSLSSPSLSSAGRELMEVVTPSRTFQVQFDTHQELEDWVEDFKLLLGSVKPTDSSQLVQTVICADFLIVSFELVIIKYILYNQ